MKIRYDKEGMKIEMITVKAKQRICNRRSWKRSRVVSKHKRTKPTPEQPLLTRDEDRVH